VIDRSIDPGTRWIFDQTILRRFDAQSDHLLWHLWRDDDQSDLSAIPESMPDLVIETSDLTSNASPTADRFTTVGAAWLSPLAVWVVPEHRRDGVASRSLAVMLKAHWIEARHLIESTHRSNWLNQRIRRLATQQPDELTEQWCLDQCDHYLTRLRRSHASLGIRSNYAATHRLSPQDPATQLVDAGRDLFDRPQWMHPDALSALQAMASKAHEEGIELELVSAWRSVDYQQRLISKKLESGQSIDQVLTVSAAPGYSEHQTGLAIDLHSGAGEVLEEAFEQTDAYRWLSDHASQFGFKESFPRNNPHALLFEPWHWCYQAN